MIRVTCALIRNEENKILIVQRGENTDHPLKWEFPGGKIAPGESEEECIIREIDEELSMTIVVCGRLQPVEYDYGHKKIMLIPFLCDTLDELPLLSEHLDYKWLAGKDIMSADFSEADVIVAREYLIEITEIESHTETIRKGELTCFDDTELHSMVNRMMSMKEAEWVAASAIDNPVIFDKLLEYSFSGDKKLAFRASWTLSKVCDIYPDMIYPHLNKIIDMLDKLDNESTQRSFLRIISFTDIEKIDHKLHGVLVDHCFKALNSGFSAIAIKAYAMEILYRLSVKYPELINELSASINMLRGEGSAGIIARGRSIMKKLGEFTSGPGSSQP